MNRAVTSIFVIVIIIAALGFYQYYTPNLKAKIQPIPVPDLAHHIDYVKDVKPVIEQRCVVCHACYDAPCQLKMGSFTGIERGANKERVYDGERLVEANLTRLFEDAHSLQQWRYKDFFAVVPDPFTPETQASDVANNATNNLAESVMAHLLDLKQTSRSQQAFSSNTTFDEQNNPLDINRQYQCPTIDEVESYKTDYPLRGMPYALPSLSQNEHDTLMQWIAQGATGDDAVDISAHHLQSINEWEKFLNQDDLKSRLMSRYVFEHLFLVNLYFEKDSRKQYFKLVRSATAPGKTVKGIFTRRPFDDPNVDRVYYRFVPVIEALVHKSHMPFLLNKQRMDRWKKWFLNDNYEVTSLPSYLPEEASNPFITYAQIPLKSRYKYMLDEAQNTIMQFIKGPVCRGQMALNVINDHFWVVFADPELELVQNNDKFMREARQKIRLPAQEQSNALPTAWMNYAAMEREYLKAKSAFIKNHMQNKVNIDLGLLWNGDGNNQNLGLTIFRHKDAATVVKGLVGDNPQTAWVLTYPLFERIHYLLVAGYDVYGNIGHQLNSRMYMDFLRMEGEFNFLSFLPENERKKLRDKWYRGSVSQVEQFVYDANTASLSTNIEYLTETPYKELLSKFKETFSSVLSNRHNLKNGFDSKLALSAFNKINTLKGIGVSILPEATIVRVFDKETNSQHFYSMLRHSAHSNISHLFNEEDRRLPREDTLTIGSGFMTSHPNAFLQIELNQLQDFALELEKIRDESDYVSMVNKYGVRRTNPDFWDYADNMHTYFAKTYPVESAYLDFNRLENR